MSFQKTQDELSETLEESQDQGDFAGRQQREESVSRGKKQSILPRGQKMQAERYPPDSATQSAGAHVAKAFSFRPLGGEARLGGGWVDKWEMRTEDSSVDRPGFQTSVRLSAVVPEQSCVSGTQKGNIWEATSPRVRLPGLVGARNYCKLLYHVPYAQQCECQLGPRW